MWVCRRMGDIPQEKSFHLQTFPQERGGGLKGNDRSAY